MSLRDHTQERNAHYPDLLDLLVTLKLLTGTAARHRLRFSRGQVLKANEDVDLAMASC